MDDRDWVSQVQDVARVVGALAPLVPDGVAFFRELLQGHADPRIRRVADLLPDTSLSEQAARAIRGDG